MSPKQLVTKGNSFIATLKSQLRRFYTWVTSLVLRYPLGSFFGLLGILFAFILIGNYFSKSPEKKAEEAQTPKPVGIFSIGQAPRIQVTAKVEKTGVITVVAQSPGIVQQIYKKEGDTVGRGTWITWLSTNYQGGSAQSVARQLAQKNVDFVRDNYDTQKDLIGKRRELANKLDDQSGDLRSIADKSIGDTKTLITLNEEILTGINSQIQSLEQTNIGGGNDSLILQAKQGKAGVLAGLSSLKNALRSTEYQASGENAPAQLSRMQKELTLKQLELEEKSLELNRDIAQLNLRLAQISESLLYPASPVAGTVQRIHVRVGQSVNPGTVIATITCPTTTTDLLLSLPSDTAKRLSRIEKSTVSVGGKTIELTPRYIATEATDGTLVNAFFTVPDQYNNLFTNGSSVLVEIPVGQSQASASFPYIPLDALYQTNTESYVYVATSSGENTWKAAVKPIKTGAVFGHYVEATEGIGNADQIITNRNVIDGDTISILN